MARVQLENVSKIYQGPSGPVRAVDRVNLDIRDREFVVLVGPSGCGKSTTLRMIAGLEEISEGAIRIADRLVNTVAPKDRDIAMVFQNYALYPHMSVYKNMAFGLMLRRCELGVSKAQIDQRVREAAQILGITPYLDRKPKALSGGQRQRVAVGRAIVRNPKAFLFDEPLSNLDAKLRVETRAEIKKLHLRLQTTTVYVTHDQEEAMTLGDRIVVMKDGKIQQCAPPLEVYDRPVNRFVAGFVGTPPMNFFSGVIAEGPAFVFGKHRIALPESLINAALPYMNKPVICGIRPENLSPAGEGKFAGPHNSFTAQIKVMEPLGDRVDIYLETEGHEKIVCRVDARQFARLENERTLPVFVDLSRIHLFAANEAEENIAFARETAEAAA